VSERPRMIGYNRTVKLPWLDETVDLYLAGQSEAEIGQVLRERLQDQLSVGSNAERGSREKTITILLKTWVRVPARVGGLRDEGIGLLRRVRRSERLPLHWGMTMAAYPFWRVVADVTGRLFRLQGTASAQQVQRRVRELHGEREAVSRSARYVLRAFADWGVIADTEAKGTYVPAPATRIDDPLIGTWLLEAALFASEADSTDFKGLVHSPALFPFHLARVSSESLRRSGRLDVVRHGMEEEMVLLRHPILEGTGLSRTSRALKGAPRGPR
jgi:hypothetical protein